MRKYTIPFTTSSNFYTVQNFISDIDSELVKHVDVNDFEIKFNARRKETAAPSEISIYLHGNERINLDELIENVNPPSDIIKY